MKSFYFFDYVFYKITKFYEDFYLDSAKSFAGSLTTCLLQSFNFVVIYNIIYVLIRQSVKIPSPKIILILFFIIMSLINSFRYIKYQKYKLLIEIWNKKEYEQKTKINIFVSTYIFTSILIVILSLYFLPQN